MAEKLTKAKREMLADLAEGPLYALAGAARRTARELLAMGYVRHRPETANLFEAWNITRAGRAFLNTSEG